jgi:hypothetical protein
MRKTWGLHLLRREGNHDLSKEADRQPQRVGNGGRYLDTMDIEGSMLHPYGDAEK